MGAPDAGFLHANHLRNLVKEEKKMQQQRKSHFLSTAFTVQNVGPLFPASWTATIVVDGEDKAAHLEVRPELKRQVNMLGQVLNSAAPVLDKCTEDGMRFRVYKIGSLE